MAVIKHLNVMDHITSGIISATIKHPGSPLGFQTVKEALCNCIIPTIAFSTHAANHAVGRQKFLVITTGILAAAIRVVNQSFCRLPPPISHRKSFRDQRCLHAAIHRPADYFPRVQVNDHRQIQPSFHGPQISNVAAPHGIRLFHLKIPIQKIRRHGQVMLAVRCYSELLAVYYRYAGFFHQAARTITTYRISLPPESFGCSARTIGPSGFTMNLPNF